MLSINFTNLISQKFFTKIVDILANAGQERLNEQMLAQFHTLPANNTFLLAFEQALEQGSKRFVEVYLDEDEDLVEAIIDHAGFFEYEQVQEAFLSCLREPSNDMANVQMMRIHSFDEVLPRRRNRKRVNRAMSIFLTCLAQQVWCLPQLDRLFHLIVTENEAHDNILSIYHNLPTPDYERFVGRKGELAQLEELLSSAARHFAITIDGIGGIGKSALALEVAHNYLRNVGKLLPAERFDAIIWVTAKQSLLTGQGIVARPQSLRTLDDIYSAIASTLQREDITRARSEEQDSIVYHALTEQRSLLIIDNLETVDDERVMRFIRHLPAPTKAIVTTRHRLNVAYPIRLDEMSNDESLELIDDESRRKQIALTATQATRLYKRTGGVPLAIVWSIAQMSFGHNIEAILTRLAQPNSDIARFCFQSAIHLIRNPSIGSEHCTPAYKLLLALSLFATDASRDALGYVTELPILDRDEGLEELERLSLVNKENRRFVLLPLTKVYSEEELRKEKGLEETFRERLVGWLLEFVTQKRINKYSTVEDVRPELNNILGTIDWCKYEGRTNQLLSLIQETDFYLWTTGNWLARTKYLELGYKTTENFGNEWLQADFLRRLADDADFRGDLNQANFFIQKAINIYKSYSLDYRYILSLFRLSSIQAKQKRYESALKIADEGLLIAKTVNHTRMIMRMEGRLAKIRIREGKYDLAKPHIVRAIQLNQLQSKDKQEHWSMAWLHRMLGRILLMENKYDEADQNLQKSLTLGIRVGTLPEVAKTNNSIAMLKFTIGEKIQAERWVSKALRIFIQIGMTEDIEEAQALLDEITAQQSDM